MSDEPARGSEWTAPPPPPAPASPPAAGGYPAAPSPYATASAPASNDWLGRLLVPIMESRGWLKFLGVVGIVLGILTALTIFGLVFIWLGVLCLQASRRAESAFRDRDPAMIEQYLGRIKTMIVIAGVYAAASLAMTLVGLTMALFFGWMAYISELF